MLLSIVDCAYRQARGPPVRAKERKIAASERLDDDLALFYTELVAEHYRRATCFLRRLVRLSEGGRALTVVPPFSASSWRINLKSLNDAEESLGLSGAGTRVNLIVKIPPTSSHSNPKRTRAS